MLETITALPPPSPYPANTGRLGLDKCMFSGIKGGSLLMITQVFKGNFRLLLRALRWC